MAEKSQTADLLRKVADAFKRIDDGSGNPAPEDRRALKAFYIEHFAPPEARDLFRRYFPEALEEVGRTKWIDPNSDALAFLRKPPAAENAGTPSAEKE